MRRRDVLKMAAGAVAVPLAGCASMPVFDANGNVVHKRMFYSVGWVPENYELGYRRAKEDGMLVTTVEHRMKMQEYVTAWLTEERPTHINFHGKPFAPVDNGTYRIISVSPIEDPIFLPLRALGFGEHE